MKQEHKQHGHAQSDKQLSTLRQLNVSSLSQLSFQSQRNRDSGVITKQLMVFKGSLLTKSCDSLTVLFIHKLDVTARNTVNNTAKPLETIGTF